MASNNTTMAVSPLNSVSIDSGEPLTSLAVSSAQPSQPQLLASTPVELSDLSGQQHNDGVRSAFNPSAILLPPSNRPDGESADISDAAQPAPVARQETEAIGPASDQPLPRAEAGAGPTLMITLLLPSGARHPFKIDSKYLGRRGIQAEDNHPMNISVYNMKELIWRDWRAEWEPRPTSPSFIRLIFFGAMLDDKAMLKECRFNTESPNVVHMSVKPQEIAEEEDVKQSKHSRRGEEGERRGLNCCVIL